MCCHKSDASATKILAFITALLIGKGFFTRETTRNGSFVAFWFSSSNFSTYAFIIRSRRFSSIIATKLELLRVIKPSFELILSIYFPSNAVLMVTVIVGSGTTKNPTSLCGCPNCYFAITFPTTSKRQLPADRRSTVLTGLDNDEHALNTRPHPIGFGAGPVSQTLSVDVYLSLSPRDTINL